MWDTLMPIWKQHISKMGFPFAVTLANIQYLWMLSPPVSQVRSLIIVHEKWTIFIAGFCVWKLWCKLHLLTLPWFLPAAEHLASLVNCSNEYEAVGGEGVLRICPLDRFFERGGWKWPLLLPKRQFSIYLRFYSPFPSPWYRPSIWKLQMMCVVKNYPRTH